MSVARRILERRWGPGGDGSVRRASVSKSHDEVGCREKEPREAVRSMLSIVQLLVDTVDEMLLLRGGRELGYGRSRGRWERVVVPGNPGVFGSSRHTPGL